LRLHYENASSHEGFTAFDPNANGLDSGLPSGTTVNASGDLNFRRSEVGVDWRSAGDQWKVGYRQLWTPFSVRGMYAANISIVTLSQEGDITYTKANLGALAAAYSTPLSRARLTVGIQQIVPFLLERAPSAGSGTGVAGSSRSFGGTSLALELSIPLG
jgi:hypothetical protein